MSPQPSNRAQLIEGTLRCLEDLPPERITARAIAAASGANLASITYHFGSKDVLITEAVIEGLDRWLAEVDARLQAGMPETPVARFSQAWEATDQTRRQHAGLARTFLAAIAKAQHDDRVRRLLVAGFQRTRRTLAEVLGLGDDLAGHDAAGLILAMFDGLLFQTLLDDDLAIEGERMAAGQALLRTLLPNRAQ